MATSPTKTPAIVVADLPKKTGRSLEQWVAMIRAHGPASPQEQVVWLRHEHRLSHSAAHLIAKAAGRRVTPIIVQPTSPAEMLAAQYSGARAILKPIYEVLALALTNLGRDVIFEPALTCVTLMRKRRFGVIQATTRARVDLGLALPGIDYTDRLLRAGALGDDHITHRLDFSTPAEIDEEVRGWMKMAYANGR